MGDEEKKYQLVGREHVLEAIAECDRVGRDAFLEQHGFGRANRFLLAHRGRLYDPEALVGVANGHRPGGVVLAPGEFSGGKDAAVRILRREGFTVLDVESEQQLLLQPRGFGKAGEQHFAKTVRDGVLLDDYEEASGRDATTLRKLYGDGVARFWGSTPTDGNRKNAKWNAIAHRRAGDRVLFYSHGVFIAEAVILHDFTNEPLAKALWGGEVPAEVFSHVMALGDVRLLSPAWEASAFLQRAVNRKDLRSLTLLDAERHAELAHLLGAEAPDRDTSAGSSSGSSGRSKRASGGGSASERFEDLLEGLLAGKSSRQDDLALFWALGQQIGSSQPVEHTLDALREGLAEVCEAIGEPAGDSPWTPGRSGQWAFPGTGSTGVPRVSLSPQFSRTAQSPVRRTKVFNTIMVTRFSDVEDRGPLLVATGLARSGRDDGAGAAGKAPERRSSTTKRVVRSREVANGVKAIHDDQCQFCGLRLRIGPDRYYSEGAHIKGLGDHDGPDTPDNVLCLCPSCHKQFDWFVLYVDEDGAVRHVFDREHVLELRRDPRHEINPEYLAYHRSLLPLVDTDDEE